MSSRGIVGAMDWVKVAAPGEAPLTGPADLIFLLLATGSPAKLKCAGDLAGHTAH